MPDLKSDLQALFRDAEYDLACRLEKLKYHEGQVELLKKEIPSIQNYVDTLSKRIKEYE